MATTHEVLVPVSGMGGRKLSRGSSHGSNQNLDMLHQGEGLEYRIQTVEKNGVKKPISLWHDVTLVHVDPTTDRPTPYLNYINEIPKFTR